MRLPLRVAVLGAAALTAVALTALPAPAETLTGANTYTGATTVMGGTYIDSGGSTHLIGEVLNNGDRIAEMVHIPLSFFDAENRLLGTDTTDALVHRIARGERSPYEKVFTPPAGFHHYTATATGTATDLPPNHNFTTRVTSDVREADGSRHLALSIRNDNALGADNVSVALTFYDAAGVVIAVGDVTGDGYPDLTKVGPGQLVLAGFAVPAVAGSARVAVLTQSDTPVAAASPSPSPSETPSATPTASTSPSPSPSPSPAEAALRTSVSPGTISAGARAIFTIAAQPRATVTIFARTQPARTFSPIRTVVTDDAGRAYSTHAPQKNTRMTAGSNGVMSGDQPLIQVRSVGSLSVTRVGPRTDMFTGRIYPALDQRLVSLYRNGVLIAQGRTNRDGIYSLTRTLAAGTFSFFVRTSNDTYNLGTTTPTRVVTVS